MLSQRAHYALRALIVLAGHDTASPMMIADIAGQARVPRKFLEQILLDLKRRGIVRSQRGRQGGYFLGRAPWRRPSCPSANPAADFTPFRKPPLRSGSADSFPQEPESFAKIFADHRRGKASPRHSYTCVASR